MSAQPGGVGRTVKVKLPGETGVGGSRNFTSAYVRLTLWYVLIIMVLSIVFSLVAYFVVAREIDNSVRTKKEVNQKQSLALRFLSEKLEEETSAEVKLHIALYLAFLNIGVFFVAGVLGYRIAVKEIEPIKEALDLQSQFTADASHEIRTPLAAMKTEIEVALRSGEPFGEEARRLLESNLEEIDKLDDLSSSLLELSRYETGMDIAARRDCSVAEIVEESVSRVGVAAGARGIAIRTDVDEATVVGVRGSLVELLVILLDNAVKYSGEGTEVSISSHRRRHHLVITVKDQGAGIDAADLPHVFERFYRAEHSRPKDQGAGFGLGLSIARKIVTAHQGSIELDSEPGRGTAVNVKLPTAR